MIQRYLTSVPPGIAITLALLLAMQGLIANGKAVMRPLTPERFPLQFGRTVEDKPIDVVKPVERIDPPMPLPTPLDRKTGTDDRTGIHIPRHVPKPTPTGTDGLDGFRMTDGPLVHVIRVRPDYPAKAIRLGIEGFVTVRFDVGADGQVSNVLVVESSSRLLDNAATKAAMKFRFKPRVVDGSPVAVNGISYRFRFEIDK